MLSGHWKWLDRAWRKGIGKIWWRGARCNNYKHKFKNIFLPWSNIMNTVVSVWNGFFEVFFGIDKKNGFCLFEAWPNAIFVCWRTCVDGHTSNGHKLHQDLACLWAGYLAGQGVKLNKDGRQFPSGYFLLSAEDSPSVKETARFFVSSESPRKSEEVLSFF